MRWLIKANLLHNEIIPIHIPTNTSQRIIIILSVKMQVNYNNIYT